MENLNLLELRPKTASITPFATIRDMSMLPLVLLSGGTFLSLLSELCVSVGGGHRRTDQPFVTLKPAFYVPCFRLSGFFFRPSCGVGQRSMIFTPVCCLLKPVKCHSNLKLTCTNCHF